MLLLDVKMGAERGWVAWAGGLHKLRPSPASSYVNSETASPQRMWRRAWPGSPRAKVAVCLDFQPTELWEGLLCHFKLPSLWSLVMARETGPGSVGRSWDSCSCDLETSAFFPAGAQGLAQPKPGRTFSFYRTPMPFRLGQIPLMMSWHQAGQKEPKESADCSGHSPRTSVTSSCYPAQAL